MDYSNEADLFAAFRVADPAAANAIFVRHFKPLCFFTERLTGSHEEAEDIVSDTFVKMLERRSQFESLDNIRAFLYRSARNAAINYYRAARRHDTAHQQLFYIGRDDRQEQDWLEEETIRVGVLAEIYQEIEFLPGKCREIFKGIFFKGLSTEQIAIEMGITIQTVRSQKARALQLLKVRLLKKGHLTALLYALSFLAGHK